MVVILDLLGINWKLYIFNEGDIDMKALWAFEPSLQDQKRLQGMYKTLSSLAGSSTRVEVGFVATHGESLLNQSLDIPESDRFSTYPQRLIKQELKNAQIHLDNKKIHVLDYATSSNTKAVDQLLKLAKSRGAKIIGLFTHARKGYLRYVIGSFAETAIHKSQCSLLIFNPQTQVASQIKNILFASDFSPASKKQLKTVISHCKSLKSKLTVLYHADLIYKWSLDETNPSIHAYRQGVGKMKKWIERECHSANVSVEVLICTEIKSTGDLILENITKKNIHLVVVGAKVGPVAALIGGSVTRQIVRGSLVPVLVLK